MMKTTIDLPPDLLRSVTAMGIALPELVADLLRAYLADRPDLPADRSELLAWRDELL